MNSINFCTGRVARIVCASVLFLLAGAALAADGAPQLVVGDRWHYRLIDNLRRGAQSDLEVEVIAVTGRAARVRVTRTDATGRSEWIDDVDGEGGLRAGSLYGEPVRPFAPPVRMLAFPLDKGKTWRQTINTMHKDTGIKDQILIYGKVNGPASSTVPAGTFDTIAVYRTVELDDTEFWRTRTSRRDSIWYAPAVKAPVREKREAEYRENGGLSQPMVRTESTVMELVSFSPGGK